MELSMFPEVMSLNRFQFLISQLCLYDPKIRKYSWESDWLATFWGIFEQFNDNCAKHSTPNFYMLISIFLFLDERNISADHLYTSMTPTKLLLNKYITTGNIQHNGSGIPKNVKSVKNREDFTCSVYWEDN